MTCTGCKIIFAVWIIWRSLFGSWKLQIWQVNAWHNLWHPTLRINHSLRRKPCRGRHEFERLFICILKIYTIYMNGFAIHQAPDYILSLSRWFWLSDPAMIRVMVRSCVLTLTIQGAGIKHQHAYWVGCELSCQAIYYGPFFFYFSGLCIWLGLCVVYAGWVSSLLFM